MRRFDGKVSPKDVLVDVIALSRRSCTHPIQGCLAYATRENFVGKAQSFLQEMNGVFRFIQRTLSNYGLMMSLLSKAIRQMEKRGRLQGNW